MTGSDPTAPFTVVSLDAETPLTLLPGIRIRPIFGEGAMINLVELEAGAELPAHSHPHEQLGLVLRGVQILVVEGREYRLGPNEGYVVPSGVEHGGRGGPEGCLVIDVFQPVREDYRSAWLESRTEGGST